MRLRQQLDVAVGVRGNDPLKAQNCNWQWNVTLLTRQLSVTIRRWYRLVVQRITSYHHSVNEFHCSAVSRQFVPLCSTSNSHHCLGLV